MMHVLVLCLSDDAVRAVTEIEGVISMISVMVKKMREQNVDYEYDK